MEKKKSRAVLPISFTVDRSKNLVGDGRCCVSNLHLDFIVLVVVASHNSFRTCKCMVFQNNDFLTYQELFFDA